MPRPRMMLLRVSLVALLGVVAAAQTDSHPELLAAIRRGSVPDVQRLLKSGASPEARDSDGTSALMAATLYSNAPLMEILLEHGADPNRTGAGGTTALMWAVPDLGKVRLLLARGANVNA
ncbi:MAG TPA: ankyrin repeat domain-containing protein, partial [Vicinamibacterales bacterium]|nr:ankyrin repeat domain-containing protein [Vicinamibacterales bacterium]